MRIVLIALCILYTSCSPQKRLNRLLDKHPELTQKDTIIINDTIITPKISHDTLLNWATLYDTAYIEKERLRIKLIRVNDSIYIKGECIGDTIYYEKTIPVDKVVYKKDSKFKFKNSWIFILLLIFVVVYLLRR